MKQTAKIFDFQYEVAVRSQHDTFMAILRGEYAFNAETEKLAIACLLDEGKKKTATRSRGHNYEEINSLVTVAKSK